MFQFIRLFVSLMFWKLRQIWNLNGWLVNHDMVYLIPLHTIREAEDSCLLTMIIIIKEIKNNNNKINNNKINNSLCCLMLNQ